MPSRQAKQKTPAVSSGKTEKRMRPRSSSAQVGVASRSGPAPTRRISFKTSNGPKNSLVTQGTEYIGAIVAPTLGLAAGQILSTQGLNPGQIAGTRLNLYSKMYEKYCIKRICFHYSSACPTSVPGDYVMFIDRDAADQALASTELLRQAYSVASMQTGHFWESKSVVYRPEDPQKFYYTSAGANAGAEARLDSPGTLRFISATASTLTNTSLGQLWVEYEIHWYDPTIETPIESATSTARRNGTNLTSGTAYGFADLLFSATGGAEQEFRVDGSSEIHLPPMSGNTSAASRSVYDIVEEFVTTNVGVAATGIVDQLFVYPVTAGGVPGAVKSVTDATIASLFDFTRGVGNGFSAMFSANGFKAPDYLSESNFASLANYFGIGAHTQITAWHLYGTLVAGMTTAATHNLRVSRRTV